MNWLKLLCSGLLCTYVLTTTSCAPVRFSKANTITVSPQCTGAICNTNSVQCDPKINGTLTTYTYQSGGPANANITSNCNPSAVDYTWVVKRPDSSIVSTPIPGLSGANPQGVDFRGLGTGVYYVYLTANQPGGALSPYNASAPLEFIVGGVGNALICDPKLNATQTTVTVGQADSNPTVTANCAPPAGSYTWTATKNGISTTIAGLSGGSSVPDFKNMGAGTYKVYLYATSSGSQHWQSSTPLTVNVTAVAPTPVISCNPTVNGSQTSTTVTTSSSNPLISANCLPSAINYNWTVTRNGSNVSVPGLSGASSNPNFQSLGAGTYLVYLAASSSGYTTWNTTTPLTITVDSTGPTTSVSCAPRLNNSSTAITITTAGPNPLLTSSCTPASAAVAWTVTRNGTVVNIPGLSGTSSTPDFVGAGLGTYFITLGATASGYNAYATSSPLEVTVAQAVSPTRRVNYQKTVQVSDNKVDILMVVDDSNSMAPENTRLAAKLHTFVDDLSAAGLDWQMCSTVTRGQDVNNNGILYWGASKNWVNYVGSPKWILKMGASDPYSIFTNTMQAIGAGWAGTDDERGIKAAWWSAEYAPYNNCYRNDASLAVIMISDEDESSVGGDASKVYYSGELQSLEVEDLPQAYVTKIKQTFGTDKRFTFNSIIVKPGDTACMTSQDAEGAKSHYGYKYNELSQITGGSVGSICASDYSSNLYYFKDRIVNKLSSIALECAPVGNITVTITPTIGAVSTQVVNNTITFSPAIPAGRTIQLGYDCPRN
ncbi:MAG: hypothetical protein H7061_02780 [Bdellovibrionaceae bacterium]|nr:hypothetical protein [Bdellovibrio sp.]